MKQKEERTKTTVCHRLTSVALFLFYFVSRSTSGRTVVPIEDFSSLADITSNHYTICIDSVGFWRKGLIFENAVGPNVFTVTSANLVSTGTSVWKTFEHIANEMDNTNKT